MSQTISGSDTLRGHIYIFLQATTESVKQWVAISDDGYCLAHAMLPPKAGFLSVWRTLGNESANRFSYEGKYPHGYDLNIIEDINSPDNALLLNRIREVTSAVVKAAQDSGKYKHPGLARGDA